MYFHVKETKKEKGYAFRLIVMYIMTFRLTPRGQAVISNPFAKLSLLYPRPIRLVQSIALLILLQFYCIPCNYRAMNSTYRATVPIWISVTRITRYLRHINVFLSRRFCKLMRKTKIALLTYKTWQVQFCSLYLSYKQSHITRVLRFKKRKIQEAK